MADEVTQTVADVAATEPVAADQAVATVTVTAADETAADETAAEETAAEVAAGPSWKVMVFVAVQVVFWGAGIGWGTHRMSELEARKVLPEIRNEPLHVGPRFDDAEVVSDAQLAATLNKLRPQFRLKKARVNHIDHALRFWGVEAKFDDEHSLSGVEMRDYLLDHRQFARLMGKTTQALLLVGPNGVRPRIQEGESSTSHVDHTLATLAEVGTPLDFPVYTARSDKIGERQVQHILRQSLRDFSLNQAEYEWSALAYALYMPTDKSWFTTEGQRIDFDRLAERVMRQALSQGVCLGNHRLHALVMLLRVDEQQRILSDAGRAKVTAYLKDVTRRFVAMQKSDGYWDRTWPGYETAVAADSTMPTDPLSVRLLATGHVMEWWSLAPQEIQPPREVLVKAGQWLVKTIEKMSPREIDVNYTVLTHAGRALALWRGKFPAQVALPAWPKEEEGKPVEEKKDEAVKGKS